MLSNKVLFISPTPTHPTNAGNRQHIKSLVNFFKTHSWEVHLLYLSLEDYNEKEMKDFIGRNLYIIPKNIIYQNKKTLDYIVKKIFTHLSSLYRKIQMKIGVISKEQFLYNREVDEYASVFVKPILKSIKEKNNFDVVICEYAFTSKYLDYFDSTVFKILDTHDRFTDRFNVYLENKIHPTWVSLYRDQEEKALKRANLILAVQNSDAEYFSKLSSITTSVFNYVPEIKNNYTVSGTKSLLYFASANEINIRTLKDFVKDTFPLILNTHPDAKLIVGGSICDKFNLIHNNILFKGKFQDISTFYDLGDIVINPEKSGTGYKIKALEALSFSMPLIATTAGAQGAINPFKKHLFIADTSEEFSQIVNKLFSNPEILNLTSINAFKWINNHKNKMDKELLNHLPKHL